MKDTSHSAKNGKNWVVLVNILKILKRNIYRTEKFDSLRDDEKLPTFTGTKICFVLCLSWMFWYFYSLMLEVKLPYNVIVSYSLLLSGLFALQYKLDLLLEAFLLEYLYPVILLSHLLTKLPEKSNKYIVIPLCTPNSQKGSNV